MSLPPLLFHNNKNSYALSQEAIASLSAMPQRPHLTFLPPTTITSLGQYTQTTGGMVTSSYEYNERSTAIPPHQFPPLPTNSVMGSSRSITSYQLAPQLQNPNVITADSNAERPTHIIRALHTFKTRFIYSTINPLQQLMFLMDIL